MFKLQFFYINHSDKIQGGRCTVIKFPDFSRFSSWVPTPRTDRQGERYYGLMILKTPRTDRQGERYYGLMILKS